MHVVTYLHYNLSRIERRIQQQKRYLFQYGSYYFLADIAKIKVFFEKLCISRTNPSKELDEHWSNFWV